jgi:Tol biopolymer transport system component
MALAPGTRLGAYEILALIGSGGIRQVYRARDTKLAREVALKILPDEFARDPSRVARFQREAQLLAALNHPNIAAIYGLEESSGTQFLVLELIDGESLARRIESAAVPIDEALLIARQIVDALEAAHDKGIIHRDLKPANIMLTADGTVKVLDFGLAKALENPAESGSGGLIASQSPTLTVGATQAGVILGTAAYMAPEQAKGRAADKRSDVWAFGCVLFEMLTGRRAFEGEDVSDTLAAVLRGEPNWSSFTGAVPPSIQKIVRRCLEKDLKTRIPDIVVLRFMLDDAGRETEGGGAIPSADRTRNVIGASILGLLLGAAAASLAAFLYFRPVASTDIVRFSIENGLSRGLGPGAPILAVSPDGRSIALVARGGGRQGRILLRSLDALTLRELPGTEGGVQPFWSPDSRFLAFFADGTLKKIDVRGGPAVPICDVTNPLGGAWSDRGFIVFGSSTSGLRQVAAAGGSPTPVTTLTPDETGHVWPSLHLDGEHIFYRVIGHGRPGSIHMGSMSSSERSVIIEDPGASTVAHVAGQLLFLRANSLMAQPFDAERGALTGEPIPIADQVQTLGNPGAVGLFSVSKNGVLVYQPIAMGNSRLTWFDRGGRAVGTVSDEATYGDVEISPDGKRVAVSIFDTSQRSGDIWIVDIARGIRSRFTFDGADESTASWSPDGSRLAFNSRRKGNADLYVKNADLTGSEELILADNLNKWPFRWSRDSTLLSFISNGGPTLQGVWVLPLSGESRTAVAYADTPFREEFPQLSPDGRWMAYKTDESKVNQIVVDAFPKRGARVQVSTAGGNWVRWRSDGREIFWLGLDDQLMAASIVESNNKLEVGEGRTLFRVPPRTARTVTFSYDVAKDGQQFLFNTPIDNTESTPVTVVLNWTEQLRK